MIYRDWSSEFGTRLQKITNIPSEVLKYCFEYKQKAIPENKYICCDDNGIMPISIVTDRYKHRLFPILLLDAEYLQSDKLLEQPESFFNSYGIKKIDNARYDLIIPLINNFESHKKSLERIGRCYNKCVKNTTYKIYDHIVKPDNYEDILKEYSKYWENKKEEPISLHRFNLFLDTINNISHTYTITVSLQEKVVAVAYFEIAKGGLYWHETLRYTELGENTKLTIGNYILLLALENICYPKNMSLNLGVSWFDYKKHWHPIERAVQGIDFIDCNQKIFTL